MIRWLVLLLTHAVVAVAGFAAGIYVLPILVAPPAPDAVQVTAAVGPSVGTGRFDRDLPGSDWLHWGEGRLLVGRQAVGMIGHIAPGPDYRLYLSPVPVADRDGFQAHRGQMVQVGRVHTFDNFIVPLPAAVDPRRYRAAVVWCESFGAFISAAPYDPVAGK